MGAFERTRIWSRSSMPVSEQAGGRTIMSHLLHPETLAHVARVEADGGVVPDPGFVDDFIGHSKLNGYFSEIVAAYSPSFGYLPGAGAGVVKLYSISGAAKDIAQAVSGNEPERVEYVIKGKPVVRFNGVDQYFDPTAFSNPQPATFILAGAEQRSFTDGRRLFDGASNINMAIYQTSSAGYLRGYAGATGSPAGVWPLNEHRTVRCLFNGASSEIAIDEAENTTVSMGANDGDGFTLGRNGGGVGAPANFEHGAVVLLGSAVDGSYAAKVGSVKDFFSVHYGTPWAGRGPKGSQTFGLIGDSFVSAGVVQPRFTIFSCPAMDATGGVGGNTLAQIDARLAAYVAGTPQQKTVVLGGINDVVGAASDPNATMQGLVEAIVVKIVAGGSVPTLTTLPPWKGHASWTAARQGYCDTYNAWIASYAAVNKYRLLDLPSILATGDGETLDAGFDSGDGLHPNTAGYNALTDALVALER